MEATIEKLMVLIPALPLAAAIITAILGPKLLKQWSHIPVVLCIAASFVCSAMLMRNVYQQQEQLDRETSKVSPDVNDTIKAVPYQHIYKVWTWLDIHDASQQNGLDIPLALDVVLRVDGLTSIMLCMVTFIATLVAIFAAGYMHGDRGYWRFFSYVGLFVFSMTMLVSVSNFILLFVFWEAVGVCSYLLIGFWYEKPEAAAAGKKAFLVNRIGDFGFALALFLIWTTYGTLNYHDVNVSGDVVSVSAAPAMEEDATGDEAIASQGILSPSRIAENNYVTGGVALAICLLLMLGACGKSAQFPLHVWLPDAMEGPTPVSALIHAATMVTAGVYMVTRCTPLFMASPEAQLVVSIIGGITALLAGLIALTQYDLKRVLAYSTVSQLGYMFLALGTGTLAGISGGMFHLFTHAFFKALLFLGAGSVMHAMHHIIDMRRFSGLRRIMPATHATFLIGCLALAGVWPLSGFWSKDAVVASVHDRIHQLEHLAEPHDAAHAGETHADDSPLAKLSHDQLHWMATAYQVLYYVALFVAFLTAFYTFRAFFMTFYGEEKVPYEAHGHAHESPPSMTWPLMILSIFAAVIGAILFVSHAFDNFLLHTPSLAAGWAAETIRPGAFHWDVAGVSTVVALAGILVAFYLYNGDTREVDWLYRFMNGDWVPQGVATYTRVTRARNGAPLFVTLLFGICVGLFYLLLDRLQWRLTERAPWLAKVLFIIALPILLVYQFLRQVLIIPVLFISLLSPYRLSYGKFFFDEIYNALFVWPLRLLAQLSYWFDRTIIDGLVNLCGRIPTAFGGLMRSMHFGLVPFYALAMVLGAAVLLAAKMLWAN